MLAFLLALGLLVAGGSAALLLGRTRAATFVAVAGTMAGCLVGAIPAARVVVGGAAESLRMAWDVPNGAFFVEIDALSAFFLLPVFCLSPLAAVYGAEYMAHGAARPRPSSWFFFNLLVASMAMVVVARNAVLFLVAWEIMALASFFLVTYDDGDESVRDAGWTYLVATHLGTAFLLALFVLLGRANGSLDFDRFTAAPGAGLLFVLALVGFGTKAGFVPFHVWLPEAHPAAPSHVSAVMSGVMLKMGIYGLLRTLTYLAPLPAWAGWLLVAVGATSGVCGVLYAVAQHDVKRLLAYSSIENVGIIALGLGLGLVGLETGSPTLAVLGFAGGLLHVVNHAAFKGLLFLGAGAVVGATSTRTLDALGGVLARMPRTGLVFLVGAVSVCGLPPFNGFVSELLIYLGGFGAAASAGTGAAVPGLVAIAVLALIGGLAVACFTKAFGVMFLGEPRGGRAAQAADPGLRMRLPMAALAAACLGLGVGSPLLVGSLGPVLAQVTALPPAAVGDELAHAVRILQPVSACAVGLLGVAALLAGLRRWLLWGRPAETTVTWDCGYVEPSARMQYTASSFVQPLTDLFGPLIAARRGFAPPEGFFPRTASFASETPDLYRERLYRPAFVGIERGLSAFRWLQHGRVQLYVLYVAFTLLVLLLWTLGGA